MGDHELATDDNGSRVDPRDEVLAPERDELPDDDDLDFDEELAVELR